MKRDELLRRLAAAPLFLLVFVPLVVLYVATTTRNPTVLSPDPVAAALPAWQFANHGNLTLDDAPLHSIWVTESGGRMVSNRMPGVIAAGVPFYLLARPFTTAFSLWPAALAAATMAAAAMALLALCLEPLIGRRPAVMAGLVGGVATGTWSVSADALWPHSVNQLLMALALYGMTRRSYLLVGLACMLAEPVRTHLAVVALALGVGAVVAERRLRPLFLVGVPAVLGVLAVPLYTRHVYGTPTLKAGYGSFAGHEITSYTPWDTVLNVLGFFLSPDRGLLLMSPFLLALLPGVRAAWRVAPGWVRCSALGGLAYLLVQARLNSFTGGVRFWSYRLSLESLTLFAPLLALAWQQRVCGHAARSRTFSALVAASVAVTALGAVFFTPRWPMRTWLHSWVLHLLAIGPHRTAALVVLLLGCVAAAACYSRALSGAAAAVIDRRKDVPVAGALRAQA